jgi:hypothetical protein
MPILMIALLALAVFGVIGGLLTAAVVLETKQPTPTSSPVEARPRWESPLLRNRTRPASRPADHIRAKRAPSRQP